LLPTPPRGDAVSFGFGVVAFSDTDFHRADVAPSRAHDTGFRRYDEKEAHEIFYELRIHDTREITPKAARLV